jgi:radical SAM protein with 4Fe4S-binding SPASM domain
LKTETVTFYKNHTDAQKQRFKNHTASVRLTEQGEIEVLEQDIINPNGKLKTNRLISVLPESTEKVQSFQEAEQLFSELSHLNVILTNACNLSCTYCYEQHNKDYGRFTVESLRSAWDWLLTVNNRTHKEFQFFGGEPLIHKKLILDFMNSDPTHFQEMYNNGKQQLMSICTNGLLLDKSFIDEYFSRPYTGALISLDTIRSDIDYRQISQPDINKLLEHIQYIPEAAKLDRRVVIRCTLSQEAAPYMNEFIKEIYSRGIRQMIVHPLVLDSKKGFISWAPDQWQKLHDDIIDNLEKYADLQIKFVEGVGRKTESNCMVGSDMIAIDASGDFSGCYFFTNMKTDGTGHTILGNVFKNQVYTDRYTTFQKMYNEMFETEEQCKTCDYRQACYQCPAGNSDTGPKLFRPDDMCQKIVKLYIDLQDDVNKKTFLREYYRTLDHASTIGYDKYIASSLMMLGELYFENKNISLTEYLEKNITNHKLATAWFLTNLEKLTPIEYIDTEMEISELYTALVPDAKLLPTSGLQEDMFYLNMIGQTVINKRLTLQTKGMQVR